MELLVWHHRLNHCSFKCLIRIPKMEIIPRNISNIRKISSCVACIFEKFHNNTWRTKGKHSSGSIRNPSDIRPGAMT